MSTTETGRLTGTKDKDYNIIAVLGVDGMTVSAMTGGGGAGVVQ